MKRKEYKARALHEWAKGMALLTTAILIYLDANTRQVITVTMGITLIILSLLDYNVYLKKKRKNHK